MAKVERLRTGLVAGTLLLVVVVAGTLLYSRYRAGRRWIEKIEKAGGKLVRETDGFTYSQSLQGKTVFTLHASKAFQHTDGLWTLRDVVITLYGVGGEKPDRADRVYGSEFEWDENKGIARATGEVQMDLQVPTSVATAERGGPSKGGGDAESIHVRTKGLVFLRKLGVAATDEEIEFRYKGMVCTARGAEFDNSPSALHLLNDVRMNGETNGKPVSLAAWKADFDRVSNVVSLVQPLLVTEGRKARSATAVLHLGHDGSVERAEATGGVQMDAGTRHVAAQRLDTVMDSEGQPETAHLSGGVKLVDDDAVRPAQGEAGEVRVRFDGRGDVAEVVAAQGAHLERKRRNGQGLLLEREMRAEQMVASFAGRGHGQSQLKDVHLTGDASVRGESATASGKGGLKATVVSADELTGTFVAAGRQVRLDRLHGAGHTLMRQTGAAGEEHESTGDVLDMLFAPSAQKATSPVTIASAEQTGHVLVRSRAAEKPAVVGKAKPESLLTGSAARMSYEGASERLVLMGDAHLLDGDTSIAAEIVALEQRTGDAEARGSVAATLAGAQTSHVSASRAMFHHATRVAEFEAGDGKPARLWQEASQVEAGMIVLDQQRKLLTARPVKAGGTVLSVFAGTGKAPGKGAAQDGGRVPSILRVVSREMKYADGQREAIFLGPVQIDGTTGTVKAEQANVFFAPAAEKRAANQMGLPAGGLERVVVTGDVRLEQPGRRGTGEQLVYKAADGSFLLTGTAKAPPKITDAQQGTVTGGSLLFRAGDSTIVVAGAPAATEGGLPRPRIETRVRQKPE